MADPTNQPVRQNLALILAQLGEIQQTLALQQAGLLWHQSAPVYRLQLAHLYAQTGDLDRARQELEAATAATDPKSPADARADLQHTLAIELLSQTARSQRGPNPQAISQATEKLRREQAAR